jgi:hypothetical protein
MASTHRRADDLLRLKVREFVMLGVDGQAPPLASIMTMADVNGNTTWSTDLAVNSINTNSLVLEGLTGTGLLTYNGSLLVNGSPVIGPAGATGPAGTSGIGATGPKGDDGPVGATGPKGDDGTVGATGPDGSVGATGATGTSYNLDPISPFLLLPADATPAQIVTSYNSLLELIASRNILFYLTPQLYFQTSCTVSFLEFLTDSINYFPTLPSQGVTIITYTQNMSSSPVSINVVVDALNQAAEDATANLRFSYSQTTGIVSIEETPGYSWLMTDLTIFGSADRFMNHIGFTSIVSSYPAYHGYPQVFFPYTSEVGSPIGTNFVGNTPPVSTAPTAPTLSDTPTTSAFTISLPAASSPNIFFGLYLDGESWDIIPVSTTSYLFHNLNANTTHDIKISILTEYDESELSSSLSVTTAANPVPVYTQGSITQTFYNPGVNPLTIQPIDYFETPTTQYGTVVSSGIKPFATGAYFVPYQLPATPNNYAIYRTTFYISPPATYNNVLLWIVSDDGCVIDYTDMQTSITTNLITKWMQTPGAATGGPWFFPSNPVGAGIPLNWTAGNYYKFDCISINTSGITTFAFYYSLPFSGAPYTYTVEQPPSVIVGTYAMNTITSGGTTYPINSFNPNTAYVGTPIGLPKSWVYT